MYRNGTYVAFDGNGTTNPTESDFKYYGMLKAWNESKKHTLTFSDSHEKTYSVRDSSQIETLKARLLERLKNSKNMLLIISDDTNYDRGMLNFEIENAIDRFKLPLIIAYPKTNFILDPRLMAHRWPKALKERIESKAAKCIHISFAQAPIFEAISQFSIHKSTLNGPLSYYTKDTYIKWGLHR
ncbi:hypothetical protein KQ941_01805 [Paenibacillus xylanexedens]|uniref:TIR domain-containing protein n=1 Tax=Paenibacillus xylanexedens TaxID=528191 RepID=UPI001F36A0A5|nr:TIR domain-containing protein [Paenibacillus xylanexedens]MCF7753160.1 hypothetical protein [Paenibacillus xylanexedens]